MKQVTPEDLKADAPTSPEVGELFDQFLGGFNGSCLLDENVIRDGDGDEWKRFILQNRMRRAFEAGIVAGETRQKSTTMKLLTNLFRLE